MRIVVHGQQAFGKAVLEALLKRGEDVIAAYAAPDQPGGKPDPLKEAALAAGLPVALEPGGQGATLPLGEGKAAVLVLEDGRWRVAALE